MTSFSRRTRRTIDRAPIGVAADVGPRRGRTSSPQHTGCATIPVVGRTYAGALAMAVCACSGCASKAALLGSSSAQPPTMSPQQPSAPPPTMEAIPEAVAETAVACPKGVHNTFSIEPCEDRKHTRSRQTAVQSQPSMGIPPSVAQDHPSKHAPSPREPASRPSEAAAAPAARPPNPFERTLSECVARVRESGGAKPAICEFPRPLDQMDFGQVHCNAKCASASGLPPSN
jgi:hypothetical protein